jgi:LuxR family transcriptional regulator, quorum-sensing system regulator BjaR1
MDLEAAISGIEACQTIDELKQMLQRISQDYGFASFNFLDTGATHLDAPFFIGTLKPDFLQGYIESKLIHVDPCVSRARRTNTPFSWGDVLVPHYKGVRKSGAQKTMEFAYDFGFQEGFIVPFHFSDLIGRINSSLVVFFWSDLASRFRFLVSRKKHEMHIIMIYWAQRAVDLIGEQFRDGARFAARDRVFAADYDLTDRERDVLAWAGRGKSVLDTAEILSLSEDTVKTHIRNALKKLGANNKTHGVTKAIYLGLINP